MDEARQRNGELRLITVWNKPPMAWYPAVLETAAGEIAAEDSPQSIAETLQTDALKTATDEGLAATGQLVHGDSPAAAPSTPPGTRTSWSSAPAGTADFPGCTWGPFPARCSATRPVPSSSCGPGPPNGR